MQLRPIWYYGGTSFGGWCYPHDDAIVADVEPTDASMLHTSRPALPPSREPRPSRPQGAVRRTTGLPSLVQPAVSARQTAPRSASVPAEPVAGAPVQVHRADGPWRNAPILAAHHLLERRLYTTAAWFPRPTAYAAGAVGVSPDRVFAPAPLSPEPQARLERIEKARSQGQAAYDHHRRSSQCLWLSRSVAPSSRRMPSGPAIPGSPSIRRHTPRRAGLACTVSQFCRQ